MNAPESDECPDLQVLAAYVEGTLDEELVGGVMAHVNDCLTCRFVVLRAAAVDEEEQEEEAAVPWWRYAVAATVLVALIGTFFVGQRLRRRPDPIAMMASAAPAQARILEPRLSGGFRWAPYQNVMAGGQQSPTGEELKARGVAGKVLNDLQTDKSAQALHAKGVAHLLRDNAGAAVALLRTSAGLAPRDPRVWNDLAAALYIHAQDDAELREALVAARRAIELDPHFNEAYFNVALIQERIGTRAEIRSAWRAYLEHDSSSGWAAEAKNRLALYRDGS